MDFAWSAEQLQVRDAILVFARKSLQDEIVERDQTRTFSGQLWRSCADFGIQGLPFPVEYGGGGADILTTTLGMETLGYACPDAGLLFGINAQMWSVQMPILRFGDAAQRERYLPRLCAGEWIGAHGMSEPDSGSDAFALRTRAVRCGDHYVLDGTKTFVSNAPVADLFLVFATVDRNKGVLGITAFLVEKETPGFSVGRTIDKMGLTTSPMAELVLEGCRVPVENRLGREGRGAAIFNDSMEWERGFILAACVGAMRRQLERCVAHAQSRRQFGRPIGSFESVADRLVAMKMRYEMASLLLYKVAWLKQQGMPAAAEAATAKVCISESWLESCLDAVRIFGGYGYMKEYEIERSLRDSVGSILYSGTSDMQRAIIARCLGV